ncbi:MAG: ABC transporter permease subunit [Spirochaetales bacterium]|nr:ABC transporter permease subunit [Spirochaetales bacterium]
MITLKGLTQIFKKEIKHYFVAPIAYIVITIFLLVSGFFFFFFNGGFFYRGQASMRDFFTLLPIVFSFVIPAITMHQFSEEFNTGSYEMLLTMPLTYLDIIIGKFLASLTLTAVSLLPTLSYAIFISTIGNLDWGPVIGGYVGALLMGASFCAIGLFASSITNNQIVSFLVGAVICFGLSILQQALYFFPPVIADFLQNLSVSNHFYNVTRGIIDLKDLIYFAVLCFIAMYATRIVMEEKK